MYYGEWREYVPVGTKLARGRAAAAKLAKKERREPAPVTIQGRKIATTFWGQKWCENLQRYRDIANRLDRGATYVRNGSVADLVIEPGRVRAIVAGSEAYTVEIDIETLKPASWKAIGRDCASEIDSLLDLLQGRFSDGVMTRLTREKDGLFPHPDEIEMECSCPDFAYVCKHIAATFYGIAATLDKQPELLFKLRNVDHLELIGNATNKQNIDKALASDTKSGIAEGDLSAIFGIDLGTTEPTLTKKTKRKATAVATDTKIAKGRRTASPVAGAKANKPTPSTKRGSRAAVEAKVKSTIAVRSKDRKNRLPSEPIAATRSSAPPPSKRSGRPKAKNG